MQRVFGFTQRLPNSLLSDDGIDPSYLSEDPLKDFKRSEELRQAALRSWAAMDNRARMLKVLRARHRTPQTFTEGQLVFVWRQPKVGEGKWQGPGVIILPTTGGAWINMRGSLWRVANEQMRSATQEESLGAEIVNRYLDSLRTDLKKNRGARRYVDVTREGPPRMPEDAPDEEEVDVEGPPSDEEPEVEEDNERIIRQRTESSVTEPEPAPMGSRLSTASASASVGEPSVSDPTSGGHPPGTQPAALRETSSSARVAPYPYPFGRHHNFYVEFPQDADSGFNGFVIEEAVAEYKGASGNFFIKKGKPEDAEIDVRKLYPKAQALFLKPGGSREQEWKNITAPIADGSYSVKVHRGNAARELREAYSHRIVPSRWLDKWKDRGEEFDNGLNDSSIPKNQGSKSRWIIQGFHDPDITILNRTVPTPQTSDVPLALQMLASIQARSWVADISSAFSQGLRGQRAERLFAALPPGGIPGEDDDILIEVLA